MPEFQAEHSANIGWARYDEASSQLEVDFKNSQGIKTSTYVYDNFPAGDWEAFRLAESKGKYFAYHIRPRYVGHKKGEAAKPEAAPVKPRPTTGDLFNGD